MTTGNPGDSPDILGAELVEIHAYPIRVLPEDICFWYVAPESLLVRICLRSLHAFERRATFVATQLGCSRKATNEDEVDNSPRSSAGNEHEDLSQLLSEIPEELADDRARSFLIAGERLLLQQMGLDEADESPTPFKEVLAGISRRRVVAEAQRGESNASLTEGCLRHRWQRMSEYLSDLVHFALRSLLLRVQHPEQMLDLRSASSETPMVRMIERIAYQEVATTHQNQAFRLQLAFQAFFPHDEVIARALRQVDRRQVDGWRELYSGILKDRELRLRPGVTVENLTLAMHLAGQAVAFRAVLGEGESRGRYEKAIDPEKETTFLSQFALALLMEFIDPGDGRTLHEAAGAALEGEIPVED